MLMLPLQQALMKGVTPFESIIFESYVNRDDGITSTNVPDCWSTEVGKQQNSQAYYFGNPWENSQLNAESRVLAIQWVNADIPSLSIRYYYT